MPCYRPMLAVPYCISQKTGKVQYRFQDRLHDAGQLSEVVQLSDGKLYPVKALPCGKCIGCRLDYSKEWAIRCTLELEDHNPSECFFVTLTYDDDHVPYRYYSLLPLSELDWAIKPEFGMIHSHASEDLPVFEWYSLDDIDFSGLSVPLGRSLSLRPRDLQLFLKRLRKWQDKEFGSQIRFYACGEYGSKTARPHYHLIVYGLYLTPPDQSTWKTIQNGNTLWESKELEAIWKQGNVIVGNVSFESCGYVARYMLKKRKGEYSDFYRTFNLVPEFTRMSLKPGIGERYFQLHKDEIYKYDQISIKTEKKGITVKPPRYFDIRAGDELPGIFDQIKVERSEVALLSMIAKEDVSGLPISEILANEEESRKFKTKILQKRSATE